MTKKVSFLICGTQKGGTTALADYLSEHPDLCLPLSKELHFFDNEEINWKRPNPNEYHKAFKTGEPNQIWGEATPIYMYWEKSMERIWQYNPAIKLIVLLRNPITRAYSHWAMEKARGNENLNFLEALQQEETRSRGVLPLQNKIYSYQERGFYNEQLRRIFRFFPKDQVLILKQEDLLNKPKKTLEKIYLHLDITQIKFSKPIHSHLGKYSEEISNEANELLRKVFWHEICQLEYLLGWDCSSWLQTRY